MRTEVLPTDDAVAQRGAEIIAAAARSAIAARGSFHIAISGGRTPWTMLKALGRETLPWDKVHIYQVDERIAPAGHRDRNLTHLQASLTAPAIVHPMPVERDDLDAAAADYARLFQNQPLDLVHLGLGPDGHTASLIPGDPVLDVVDRTIALTGVYQNRRRMTMTYPLLDSAGAILWLVTGAEKAPIVPRLLAGDPSIPAGRVRSANATLVADGAAMPGG